MKAPKSGTCFSFAMGTVTAAVGVPTLPMTVKTWCWSMRVRTFDAARAGSYPSSSATSSSGRPCTPPAAFFHAK